MDERTVLVIEDSESTQKLYRYWLEKAGYLVHAFSFAEPALQLLESEEPAAICLDLNLPGMSGLEALDRIRRLRPDTSVVVLTGKNDAGISVRALKAGAVEYLVKPVEREPFEEAIRLALQRHDLLVATRQARSGDTESAGVPELVGQSSPMRRLLAQVGVVLRGEVPVLIVGETGTGKELIARSIHAQGPRARGPFVPVNCGAIPRDLQESQFFGHERGSFTGAIRRHTGFFESAHGGTIFLDEIGEMTLEAQVKLLRALQERRVRRVGGEEEVAIDVRVVSASGRDLRTAMLEGRFREDLYYRLAVYPLEVPPLRDRSADIPTLVGHFLARHAARLGTVAPAISDEALAGLAAYRWPGNVRQLENVVQFLLLASGGRRIEAEHLPAEIPRTSPEPGPAMRPESIQLVDPLTGSLKPFERIELEIYLRAREIAGGNLSRAAEMLGVGRSTIYRRLRSSGEAEEETPAE
jgi:DNA-binding NtrC family response regulator